jgi:hypothetical protein
MTSFSDDVAVLEDAGERLDPALAARLKNDVKTVGVLIAYVRKAFNGQLPELTDEELGVTPEEEAPAAGSADAQPAGTEAVPAGTVEALQKRLDALEAESKS